MKTIHTGKAIYTVTPIGHNLFGVTKKTARGVQSTTTADPGIYHLVDGWSHRKLIISARKRLRNLFKEDKP